MRAAHRANAYRPVDRRATFAGVAALLVVGTVGCRDSVVVDAIPRSGPAQALQRRNEIAVRFHMYRNYEVARAIERQLVRGNLDATRALATSLANTAAPAGFDVWERQAAVVRERARALAGAPAIDEAARRAAALFGACASCHRATGDLHLFDAMPPAPTDDKSITRRMARHRWAADRLWEGMVSNADAPWLAGLSILAEKPYVFSPRDLDQIELAAQLQQLAVNARERSPSVVDRVQDYGELLATCVACHSRVPQTMALSQGRARQ
jgi:cytochrome c553